MKIEMRRVGTIQVKTEQEADDLSSVIKHHRSQHKNIRIPLRFQAHCHCGGALAY